MQRHAIGSLVAGLSIVLVAAMLVLTSADLRAGLFDSARDEVRSGSSSAHGGGGHGGGGHHDDDDGGSILGDIVGGILSGIFSGGSDHYHHHGHYDSYDSGYVEIEEMVTAPVEFASFPYADGAPGLLLPQPYDEGAYTPGHSWNGRFRFEYASDFDDIEHWGAGVLMEGCRGWGIDAEWIVFSENLGPGLGHDRIDIGDVNLLYRLIETERSLWRFGGGMSWFDDSIDTDYGGNFTIRADFFPVQPWIYSGEIDLGKIGGADYFHFNMSVGVMCSRVQFFTGYDYRKIGNVELNGLVFGSQVWF